MQSIIIGKEGNQPFPIANAGVSRQHARINIDGNRWTLEDLNSTNGTFMRDADGQYHRISRIEITEDTVIRLGDESVNGFAFMAHHAIEPDPTNYAYEFMRLSAWRDEFRHERRRCEKTQRMRSLVGILISLFVIILSFMPFIEDVPNMQLMVLRVGALLPPLYNFFASGKNRMQAIYERQQRILVCPRCGRPLTDYEITKQACMTCKARS